MVNINDEKALEENGWELECESPLEIRHETSGDFASGQAARLVVDSIRGTVVVVAESEQIEKDTLEVTMVANDFLCYLQETDRHETIPDKGDVVGMKEFLQDFFDYMAEKVKEKQKELGMG